MSYSPPKVEKKWQEYWIKNQTFFTDLTDKSRPKKYILAMFPYPSGSGLHVGHIRNYTIADTLARFYRFQGYNVLMPIGWDAFGLPAEQYAIQTGNHPATFTNTNIQKFKEQLLKMGFSYDWSKEINTSTPEYYHWTQWIFCQIYQQGLAEYKEIPVYWCEKLGTVLANEEIKNVDGKKVSERGNYPVVEKKIPQWVLKITQYAPELLSGLEKLDWPNSIKSLQKNWIGLSSGTLIDFPILEKRKSKYYSSSEKITVFTTRPDTIYGVVAIALSINHPLISEIVLPTNQKKVVDFCEHWKDKKESKEIVGEFTGSCCLNPLNNEKIPIWIANFVVSDYGTGAVMISPYFSKENEWDEFPSQTNLFTELEKKQNREIDFAFAERHWLLRTNRKENWNLPITEEISQKKIKEYQKDYEIEKINQELEKRQAGKKTEVYHLKDWIFSRQRYWGEPIPVIHWENNQRELLSEKDLPLTLPSIIDFAPNSHYYSPLQKAEDWVKVERKDGVEGKRDVNVMPQWAGSCWYYIAFLLRKQKNSYLSLDSEEAKEIIKNWLPVDIYIGGQEHANLHLLYARFWHKVLYKIGVVKHPEPFQKLICQGIILGEDGEKMSKSRGNVINPDELVEKYGADALRLAEIFLGPPEQTTSFDSKNVWAMKKWLDRVFALFTSHKEKFTKDGENNELKVIYQKTIKRVSDYYHNIKLNLVISSLMSFVNECYKATSIPLEYGLSFLKLLNPLAPHISEELWSIFQEESINKSSWPQTEFSSILPSQVNIVVQINGKTRTIIPTDSGKSKEELEKLIRENEKVKKWLEDKKVIKTITIENRLVNFVIS